MENTNIHFATEDVRPVRSADSTDEPRAETSGAHLDEGIVFGRTVSMGRHGTWGRSMERRSAKSFSKDEVDPTYSGLLKPGDYKTKQIFKGSQLLFLAYQSTGVIYGDIGTSPLYVFSSTFGANAPSRDNLIGVLSLIIWSLLIYPTFKYCFVVLRADNEGEGGTFSCYSLLSRYARITHRDPKEEPLVIWAIPKLQAIAIYLLICRSWLKAMPRLFAANGLRLETQDSHPIKNHLKLPFMQGSLAGIADLNPGQDVNAPEARAQLIADMEKEIKEGVAVDVPMICFVGQKL